MCLCVLHRDDLKFEVPRKMFNQMFVLITLPFTIRNLRNQTETNAIRNEPLVIGFQTELRMIY